MGQHAVFWPYYLANEFSILGQWYSRMAEDLDLN